MGRKASGTLKQVITLRLHPEYHKDLLELLANSPNKSRTVAEGLYALLYGANGKASPVEQVDTSREAVDALLNNWNF